MKLLLAGESWTTHSIHVKGFDTFTTSEYVEGAGSSSTPFAAPGTARLPARPPGARRLPGERRGALGLRRGDPQRHRLELLPAGAADVRPLGAFVNRLAALADYVAGGGGLLMIGGYMSFSGVDCVARYGRTALAPALPVEMFDRDDRVEEPAGIAPSVLRADHPALADVPAGDWPALLGYNQVAPAGGAETLVTVGDDPLLVIGSHGSGRSAAFTSDLAPHWAPPAFMDWDGYMPLWTGILSWLARVAGE